MRGKGIDLVKTTPTLVPTERRKEICFNESLDHPMIHYSSLQIKKKKNKNGCESITIPYILESYEEDWNDRLELVLLIEVYRRVRI